MTLRKAISASVVAAAIFAGSVTPALAQARVSDANAVKNCQFLGSITKGRYSGFLFAGPGLRKAQRKVLREAASMGATDVVWVAMNTGVVQTATASAYRC